MSAEKKDDIWFVYDGECPICQMGASMYKVRAAVGELITVDARTERDHWLMEKINAEGLDLDQGMVICYRDQLFHGDGALRIMAELGNGEGIYNRTNEALFHSPTLARLIYPLLRGARNLALRLRGVDKIRNLDAN
ncbi:MAG: DCC1-like thiol-disulfide oxidoreductase family protein [Nitratireductor sp.]